jgi:DnaB-like helicase N terminal domain
LRNVVHRRCKTQHGGRSVGVRAVAGKSDDRKPPRPSGMGRVAPHNLSAEESLLGALLLSRDAMGGVAEMGLNSGDFYKPAHQHIYEAIRLLLATGQPVDPITVAEELRRSGILDDIGGTSLLLELTAATPAISNATRYARIVQDTALLRRLISVAGEIAELGYNEPDDVATALDEAEAKVFEIAEHRVTDSTKPITELLGGVIDDIERLQEQGHSITGVPSGYNDLDELLSGMQPSTQRGRRTTVYGEDSLRARHGGERCGRHPKTGAVLFPRNGPPRTDATYFVLRGPGRFLQAAQGSAHRR